MLRTLLLITAAASFVLPAGAQTVANPVVGIGMLPTALTQMPGTAPSAPAASQAAPAVSAVPVVPSQEVAMAPVGAPQLADYEANRNSDAFGAQLFTGAFSRETPAAFNPNHVISVGDRIQLRMWNGYTLDTVLTVDASGNVVLPEVGPYRVLGVVNDNLQNAITGALRKAFAPRVAIYASLIAAQPVRVYVAGSVRRPGTYGGTSGDSILRYLDQAGGIDPDRGSFLDVTLKRGNQTLAVINLYDFMLRGDLDTRQLANGDVIFVQPRKRTVRATGLAENARRFEFTGDATNLTAIQGMARPLASATNVRVTRNTGTVRNVEYFALGNAGAVPLNDGDEIEFTADKRQGTITVRVEGEHEGPQEFVLPYGSHIGDVMKRISYTPRSDVASLQLFRQSVRDRQKTLLDTSLRSLENAVLTARSGTVEEAQLRKEEAALMLQWVDRARMIDPTGQAMIANAKSRDDILLENGDVLRVPVTDSLVIVAGEVLFPNAIAFDPGNDAAAYIKAAGGYSQNADSSRVVVAHLDGSFVEAGWRTEIRPGDQIMVLPKVDTKVRQFAKDVFQIIYQMAIAAKVVIGL